MHPANILIPRAATVGGHLFWEDLEVEATRRERHSSQPRRGTHYWLGNFWSSSCGREEILTALMAALYWAPGVFQRWARASEISSGFCRGIWSLEGLLKATYMAPRQDSNLGQAFYVAHCLQCVWRTPGEFTQGARWVCRQCPIKNKDS